MKRLANVEKEFAVLGLGEVLLRLSPPNKERILNGETFEKQVGGSELNVVSGISLLGLRTGIITKIPQNEIGKYVKNRIRFTGVSDDYLIYDNSHDARLGIYFYESGASPRKPVVVYDRNHSSFKTLKMSELPQDVFSKTAIFHVSGITLALSPEIREETKKMIKAFKENGALISFDVNYRATLWDEDLARREITDILPLIDFLFISEETSRRMFQKTGTIEEIMASYADEFGCQLVATTQRHVISPTRHTWNSLIYVNEEKRFYQEEAYQEIEVVDRIGSGDAYLAGVLFGLLKYSDPQRALEYGNAMAAIKNTIPGDMPVSDFQEISRVIREHREHSTTEMIR
ncbi:MAG TPA: sugar kinase [Bacillota bacterium]|mgnify:CR=1 FL=1|nr:sugar kinase [Bacillota bacterium]HPT87678.1 sugar kinase [Bacillota bacterium]